MVTPWRRRQRGSADALALRVLDVHGNGLGGGAGLAALRKTKLAAEQHSAAQASALM